MCGQDYLGPCRVEEEVLAEETPVHGPLEQEHPSKLVGILKVRARVLEKEGQTGYCLGRYEREYVQERGDEAATLKEDDK